MVKSGILQKGISWPGAKYVGEGLCDFQPKLDLEPQPSVLGALLVHCLEAIHGTAGEYYDRGSLNLALPHAKLEPYFLQHLPVPTIAISNSPSRFIISSLYSKTAQSPALGLVPRTMFSARWPKREAPSC